MVEKLLQNYVDIRCTLDGKGRVLSSPYVIKRETERKGPQPFGQTRNGQAWPFMEPTHARPPTDGKTKARAMEDLHCAVLDLERAWPNITEDDQDLLAKYHILQTHVLDDLLVERNLSSRSALRERILRAVKRLTKEMEYGDKRNT